MNIHNLLAKFWKSINGPLQWRLLWLLHDTFMVGVSGVILNEGGEVLLLRHRYWVLGSWGLPGGYAKKREKLEETLIREVKEETGYDVVVEELLCMNSGFNYRIEACFAGRITGGELKIDMKEIEEARFYPLDDLPDGMMRTQQDLVKLARSRSGKSSV